MMVALAVAVPLPIVPANVPVAPTAVKCCCSRVLRTQVMGSN
jgi:hypothetical protein